MAAMDKAIKKAFVNYTREKYPDEAERIITRADELFPILFAKAPDIGGKENLMAYNLDLMILAASYYEASDYRIDGPAISEIAKGIMERYGFLRKIVNVNHINGR